MTAEEHEALIQAHVDQARSELSVAQKLAEEARRRFGAEIEGAATGDRVIPVERWSAEERQQRAQLEKGVAVAVNLRHHGNLAWSEARPGC